MGGKLPSKSDLGSSALSVPLPPHPISTLRARGCPPLLTNYMARLLFLMSLEYDQERVDSPEGLILHKEAVE